MNFHSSFRNKISILFIFFIAICCTEQAIESDFESSLIIDTLTIKNLNISNYSVAPNLATNEGFMLVKKTESKFLFRL